MRPINGNKTDEFFLLLKDEIRIEIITHLEYVLIST